MTPDTPETASDSPPPTSLPPAADAVTLPALRREALTPREQARGHGNIAVWFAMAGIASGFALAATVAIAQMSAVAQPDRGHHGCPKGRRVVSVAGQNAAGHIAPPSVGWLGVEYLERTQGAPVRQVFKGSPAEQAGLRAGDVVTAVDGEVIDVRGELRSLIRASRPGSTLTLTVERDGSQVAIPATLGNLYAR